MRTLLKLDQSDVFFLFFFFFVRDGISYRRALFFLHGCGYVTAPRSRTNILDFASQLTFVVIIAVIVVVAVAVAATAAVVGAVIVVVVFCCCCFRVDSTFA